MQKAEEKVNDSNKKTETPQNNYVVCDLGYGILKGSQDGISEVKLEWGTCYCVDSSVHSSIDLHIKTFYNAPDKSAPRNNAIITIKVGQTVNDLVDKVADSFDVSPEEIILVHGGHKYTIDDGDLLIAHLKFAVKRTVNLLLVVDAKLSLRFESIMDTNGLFYYMGTDGNTKPYENPITSGKIKVKMSTRGGNDFFCIADRNPRSGTLENSFGEDPAPWLALHFRNYKIQLTAYVICQERDHLLRFWNMEGSDDGVSWNLIESRKNDASITEANPQAVFQITPSASENRYYSHLRLHCVGPSHKGSTDFDISQMEFYGLIQIDLGLNPSGKESKLIKQKATKHDGSEFVPTGTKESRRKR